MGPVDDRTVRFGRYSLHPTEGLARGTRVVHVTHKALSVLRLLVERPGRMVTKAELFERVWSGVAVSDAALTSCVRELRRALGDDTRAPKYIETLHRRGFRFVAPIADVTDNGTSPAVSAATEQPVTCFGREAPLADLAGSLAAADAGARQVVVIDGEPGIGKTTLVEGFLACRSQGTAVVIAHAACTEHDGPGEPYRPMLDALTRLCRSPDTQALLRRSAPTWLAQMPALHLPGERQQLERRTAGVTQNRMSRELTDFLEALASDKTLVLWLDDLHWADRSTLHWLGAFTSRRDRARALLIVTLRPDENASASQLAAEVSLKPWCRHLRLSGLDKKATRDLIEYRSGRNADVVRSAERIHAATEGHPLFITAILDELQAEKSDRPANVDQSGAPWLPWEEHRPAVPRRLHGLIEHQVARLSVHEAELLEVASLMAASEWSAAAVAAGVDAPLPAVERVLTSLASGGAFVRRAGTAAWPDGTIAESFAFRHALYREVLQARVPAGRGTEAHRRIGRRLEEAFGANTAAVALPLAAHFEASFDWDRSSLYHGQAAATANSRGAVEEASRSLSRALAVLALLPASESRDTREIELQMMLGATLMAARGWGAPDVQEAYRRASELCGRLAITPLRFPAYWGVWLFRWGRGELTAARDLTGTLQKLATDVPDPMLQLQVNHALWATSFCLGQLDATLAHADRGWATCRGETADTATLRYGNHHAGVCARSFASRALALQGRSAEAALAADQAVADARRFEHPFTLALALVFGAATHQTLRAAGDVMDRAHEAAEISRRHGFPLLLAWADALTGWASPPTAGCEWTSAIVQDAVDRALATGSGQFRTFNLALLAEAQHRAGNATLALATLDRALTWVRDTDERCYEAELHRLTGEIETTVSPSSGGPAASFERGLSIARAQGANLLGLRNAVSLAHIWLAEGRQAEARSLVQDVLCSVPDAPAADREIARRVLQGDCHRAGSAATTAD